MTAKDYLKQAFTAQRRKETLWEQMERLRADMEQIQCSRMQESVQKSRSLDPLGELIAAKLDEIKKLEKEYVRWDSLLMVIERTINGVECDICREVLRAWYILRKEVADIAAEMDYKPRTIREYINKGCGYVTIPHENVTEAA